MYRTRPLSASSSIDVNLQGVDNRGGFGANFGHHFGGGGGGGGGDGDGDGDWGGGRRRGAVWICCQCSRIHVNTSAQREREREREVKYARTKEPRADFSDGPWLSIIETLPAFRACGCSTLVAPVVAARLTTLAGLGCLTAFLAFGFKWLDHCAPLAPALAVVAAPVAAVAFFLAGCGASAAASPIFFLLGWSGFLRLLEGKCEGEDLGLGGRSSR